MCLTPQKIRIAARQSDLARLQAYMVGELLEVRFPKMQIEYCFKASKGDLDQDMALTEAKEKGLFTQDFCQGLLSKEYDLVVHSWKDLPTESRPGTQLAATLPRADMRDVLLMPKQGYQQVLKSRCLPVLSSSPRRAYNLEPFLKWAWPWGVDKVQFEPVRGNIPTRLNKMLAQNKALIVAKAALDRLLSSKQDEFALLRKEIRQVLDQCQVMILPLTVHPSAAAQGALAIEVAEDRQDLVELLTQINCPVTFRQVEVERQTLATYGGGCHQKIGVSCLTRSYGELKSLKGLTDSGQVLDSWVLTPAVEASFPQMTRERVFPLEPHENIWFARESLTKSSYWEQLCLASGLWVARANALPEDFTPHEKTWLWTAGLKTWQSLASRGLWVHGCSESLGEQEDPQLESIAGHSVDWLKVTHDEALDVSEKKSVATYRLKPNSVLPDIKGKTHFYWMSASAFAEAFKAEPEVIKKAFHFCGPGNTYKAIVQMLGGPERVFIRLSHRDWLRELTGS